MTWRQIRMMTTGRAMAAVVAAWMGGIALGAAPDAAFQWPEAERLLRAARESRVGFARLESLCDMFGPRFSGTTNLELAIDWALGELRRDGLEGVRADAVAVPHWVRDKESLTMVEPVLQDLHFLSLGGSVGTPPEGITAPVLSVRNFEDLARRAADARGKIVFYNFDFKGYGSGLPYRSRGAIEAAKVGAVGSLIRSLTSYSMQTPHTGMMRYTNDVPRIPHGAVSIEDAALLQRRIDRGDRVVVRMTMATETLPDAPSRNVIAEWRGHEHPDEIVVLGGHIDSWDVSPGAMDDAGGCVAAWEALRLMRELGIRPRRTLRLVWWVNEENGLRGARGYRADHAAELDQHVVAIESDFGVFQPEGFSFAGADAARAWVTALARSLAPIGADRIRSGDGGADTTPLLEAGIPTMELLTRSERYFWYHHTRADTPDKIDASEFNACVGALAVMAGGVADLPERLPRQSTRTR